MLELNHPRNWVLLCDVNGDGCCKEQNILSQWLLSISQNWIPQVSLFLFAPPFTNTVELYDPHFSAAGNNTPLETNAGPTGWLSPCQLLWCCIKCSYSCTFPPSLSLRMALFPFVQLNCALSSPLAHIHPRVVSDVSLFQMSPWAVQTPESRMRG